MATSVELAHSEGVVYTGRLSVRTQPWLADHMVMGSVLLPGTAFVELALHAARLASPARVQELVLEHPMVLPEDGAVVLQVAVAEGNAAGEQVLSVHSRFDGDGAAESAWQRHAVGTLVAGPVEPGPDDVLTAWPPPDAEPIAVDDVYTGFEAAGLDYGPFFQCLRAVWRRGDEVFVEVATPPGEEESAAAYAMHPALLDGVLHGAGVGGLLGASEQARVPFQWQGVTLHAVGSSALRARLTLSGEDAIALCVADDAGRPVMAVERLTMRKLSAEQLPDSRGERARRFLLELVWRPLTWRPTTSTFALATLGGAQLPSAIGSLASAHPEQATHMLLLPETGSGRDGDAPDLSPQAALAAVTEALAHVQAWAADDQLAQTVLVVVTQQGVAGPDGVAPDPAAAAIWGLMRSAQAEHPGRIVLVDVDGSEESWRSLPAALAVGEGQLAAREGTLHVPRLTHLPTPTATPTSETDTTPSTPTNTDTLPW
ncbi:polyketide synthase dehydratase domain-containing protein, partial [Streptomyces sp. NPDC001508]|uniref:polyketide synthase dehydratase domain-containing protein n=1 Tax=Streptomyces sp. NPDC001508 TaxID=3154656 RepID=UPI00332119BF